MALGKSFRDFVLGKTRTATRNAMEALAHNTVRELQEAGPYWDGYFANEWVVVAGNVNIPATLQGAEQSTKPEARENRVYTMPPIPPADLRKGYTIGNQMEYRAIAMDLEPGRIKGGGNETAPQDWYTNLMEGGELIRINKEAAKAAFKEVFK
jgi:hypothetical protein